MMVPGWRGNAAARAAGPAERIGAGRHRPGSWPRCSQLRSMAAEACRTISSRPIRRLRWRPAPASRPSPATATSCPLRRRRTPDPRSVASGSDTPVWGLRLASLAGLVANIRPICNARGAESIAMRTCVASRARSTTPLKSSSPGPVPARDRPIRRGDLRVWILRGKRLLEERAGELVPLLLESAVVIVGFAADRPELRSGRRVGRSAAAPTGDRRPSKGGVALPRLLHDLRTPATLARNRVSHRSAVIDLFRLAAEALMPPR